MSRQSNDEINEVIELIYKGKINYVQAKRALDKIDEKYDRPFLLANPKRKNKPWNKKYLKELKREAYNADCSKECLLYFAEVADEVYEKRRKVKKYFEIILGIIALISIIVSIIVFFKKK